MRIIIDGYNYIRQTDIKRLEGISLEVGRNELIKRLSAYKRIKNHKITVVFDGILGGSHSEERDRAGGISIIYSRKGETADEVIKRLILNSTEELLIVSSDRAIATAAERSGFTAVNSPTFALKMADAQFSSFAFSIDKEEDHDLKRGKKGPSRRISRKKRTDQRNIKKL